MILEFRRSLYLILSGLMGLLMFFILHRIVIFFYLLLSTASNVYFPYERFVFWDSLSLIIVLIGGTFYGLWIGEFWYGAVYHENVHGGLVDSINRLIWRDRPKSVEVKSYQRKLETVAEKLEDNLSTLENLIEQPPMAVLPKRVLKRTISRKSIVKKSAVSPKSSRKKKAE